MTSYSIWITEPAEKDLQEIAFYIAAELQEPPSAVHVVSRIEEAILELEHLPFRYALVRDTILASKGIRMLPVDRYVVFYTVSDRSDAIVTIIRILYGKRNWMDLL